MNRQYITHGKTKPLRLVVIALCLTATTGFTQAALQITQVSHTSMAITPGRGDPATIEFFLSEPAAVTVTLYDARDTMIKRVVSAQTFQAGDQTVSWDGTDEANQPVPAEAYHYTIQAQAATGEQAIYDPTDQTGGQRIKVHNIVWDPKNQVIKYLLKKPARVAVRIGIKGGGPLLRSLTNWVPRAAGLNEEPWNGMDSSKVIDVSNHNKLSIQVMAEQLSSNTLIVGKANRVTLIEDPTWGRHRRPKEKAVNKRPYQQSQLPIESRRDIPLIMTAGDNETKTAAIPTLGGLIPIRIDVKQEDLALATGRRHEVSFFIDGQLTYEHEVGYLPMTWMLDANKVNPGQHYITANLQGYEGNFGIATIKINITHKD